MEDYIEANPQLQTEYLGPGFFEGDTVRIQM